MPFHLWVIFFDGVKWTPFFRVFCAKSCPKLRLVNSDLEKNRLIYVGKKHPKWRNSKGVILWPDLKRI